jgi:2-phosphoglycerate kinase
MTQKRHGEPLPLGSGDLPYSKGVMARALIAAGVPADRAYALAVRVELDMAERTERTVDLERLRSLAHETLGDDEGERAVDRLRRLADLQRLDVPIVVLIGGSTGTGKSTVAAEVAHRLGITRVASTDFIRQTMRAFFSREFMPTIHYSSFEAGQAVDGDVTGDPTIVGFVDQCRHVCVGVDAAMERALAEGWSMVLEGVHLVPGLVRADLPGALLVHVIVEIGDEDVHRVHFHVRDRTTGGLRAMDKYLEHLDDIRRIQTYIVGRAHREGVRVVENANVERTIDEVIEIVMQSAEALHQPELESPSGLRLG